MTALRSWASIATAFSISLFGDGACGLGVIDADRVDCCEDGFDHLVNETGANGSRAGLSIHWVATSSCAIREGATGIDAGAAGARVEATETDSVESTADLMTL